MLYPARLHDIVISRRVVTVLRSVTCRRFPEIADTGYSYDYASSFLSIAMPTSARRVGDEAYLGFRP